MKRIIYLLLCLIPLNLITQNYYISDHCKYCKTNKSLYKTKSRSSEFDPLLNKYDVSFYFLDIKVSDTTTYISGNSLIAASVANSSLDTFAFEINNTLIIDSIIFNGNNIITYDRQNNHAFIYLPETLTMGSPINCKVFYHGQPQTSGFFSGVTSAYSDTFDTYVTWTLSEPFNAQEWWPTKQILDDKADSVWVFLTTDSSNMAGSQGILTNITNLSGGKKRYEWKSSYPINYYLISFAVADYQEYNVYAMPSALSGDSILIQNFIYDHPSCLNTYKYGIDNTINFLELFSELYSLYPFHNEKYGHCLTEIGGGMEHQTMTTIGSFNYGIVAHELAHMWWGDYVSCATWSDIWINEGFATYSDYLAHEFLAGGNYPQIWLENAHQYVLEVPSGSVYIPPNEIANEDEAAIMRIFDPRLSYLKGASIIHMLRFELNIDNHFFEILRSFLTKYADSVASGADFMHHFNDVSKTDYSYFFDQWYYGEGYPIYDINWNWQNGSLMLNAVQTSSSPKTPFFNMHMQYNLIFSDRSDTLIRLHQKQHNEAYVLNTTKEVTRIELDPNNWTLEKVNSITHEIIPLPSEAYRLWPNPSDGIFHVQVPGIASSWFEYKIYNNTGKKIISGKTHQSFFDIDLSKYSSGIYIGSFSTEGNIYYEKLFKSRK